MEIPEKYFYTIGEVSRLTRTKSHILRYWESQFKLLRPARRYSGHRKYTQREIDLINKIRYLTFEKRYTPLLTLANQITILRILFIPVIVICLLEGYQTAVIVLLSLSILTDLLDGLAARLRGERTRLGAFLDPLADKLLLSAVFLTLTYLNLLEIWILWNLFSCESRRHWREVFQFFYSRIQGRRALFHQLQRN